MEVGLEEEMWQGEGSGGDGDRVGEGFLLAEGGGIKPR